MVHGQSDFGMYALATTIHRLSDMGELAARLYSPVTFDRRGEVYFIDNFENDIKRWVSHGSGTDHAIALDPTYAKSGAFSCKITCGKDGLKRGGMFTYLPYLVEGALGFEISFTYQANLTKLTFYLLTSDGTDRYTAHVNYAAATGVLTYIDEDGSEVEFGTIATFPNVLGLFHIAKIVLDLENKNYVRFLVDDYAFSLADIPARHMTLTENRRTECTFETFHGGSSNEVSYADAAIFTQNEPV